MGAVPYARYVGHVFNVPRKSVDYTHAGKASQHKALRVSPRRRLIHEVSPVTISGVDDTELLSLSLAYRFFFERA
jgi:hypothetical protein